MSGLVGLEPNNKLVGQDNPQLPQINERIVLASNQHHLSTSRTYAQRQREGDRVAWQMVCTTTASFPYMHGP